MDRVKVGLVGCGNICRQYFERAKQFPILDIAACADLIPERAREAAEKYAIAKACTVEDILADPAIEIILNLTIPAAHAPLSLRAIEAGKHVYVEKPLATTIAEGKHVLDAAHKKGVRVGGAPDTFLGTSHQLCRQLIDDNAIGKPVAVTAFFLSRGPEPWHPDPAFFYKPGGGPMFDMGPYYLTDLINLLGPINRVVGAAGMQIPDRVVGKGPKQGTRLDVETPDHVSGLIHFASGAIGTLVTSFSCLYAQHSGENPITIYGSEGTLAVPDPNRFDGPVKLRRAGEEEWQTLTPEHDHPNGRSLGLAEMAHAIRADRPHRASGELMFAVLNAMESFLTTSTSGHYATLPDGENVRPAMMPVGLGETGELEAALASG
ncbi:MAG: Gfo/Idh/MocA family oxidoreductase [Phycisphaeraceae bacterium]